MEATHARLRSPAESSHPLSTTPHQTSSTNTPLPNIPSPSIVNPQTGSSTQSAVTGLGSSSSNNNSLHGAASNSFTSETDTEDRASNRTSSPVHVSSPVSSLPDQNSNSVRDLENAMSKHLPAGDKQLAGGSSKRQQAASPLHLPLSGNICLDIFSFIMIDYGRKVMLS